MMNEPVLCKRSPDIRQWYYHWSGPYARKKGCILLFIWPRASVKIPRNVWRRKPSQNPENSLVKQGEDLDPPYLGFKRKDDPWNLEKSRTSGLREQLWNAAIIFGQVTRQESFCNSVVCEINSTCSGTGSWMTVLICRSSSFEVAVLTWLWSYGHKEREREIIIQQTVILFSDSRAD